MHAGAILLTFACVFVGASLIIALLFHFWPRYGSVEAAISRTDEVLEEMEQTTSTHA
jgi:hypothetical protein